MLFLGAGASKAFNLPDLSEITNHIMKNIQSCKSYEKISKLKKMLDDEYKIVSNSNNGIDIEILLTVLNTINSVNEINIANPLKLLIQHINIDNLGKLEYSEFNEFKDKVATTFIDNLRIASDNRKLINQITEYYTKLLSTEYLQFNIFQTIVTTNYDNVIEIFARNTSNQNFKKYLKYRGFSDDTLPEFILHKNTNYTPSFLKLHGSLDWWLNESKTEITLSESNESYGKHLGNRLMIYPIQEKYISEFPFYYTYNSFRKMLDGESNRDF
jgi:SIR2-like domain